MQVDLSRLMDNLRIKLPGALDGVIQLEMFSALNEFFQNSNAWTEDIEFETVGNEQSYLLVQTQPGAINRLMYVVNADGTPIAATMQTPGELELVYAPTDGLTLTARVALTVTDPVTREGYPDYPDWFLNKYGNDIMDGVLGRMMSQMAKPYSNERLAIFHMKKFQNAISQAKVEAQHKNVYRGQAWRFPQTFSRRKYR
jgi:hypothetical protein